jgi:hypothetical protein
MLPLIYPGNSGGRLGTLLVHPIPDGTDSQIEGLPGEGITTDDCILVFPANTGLKSMYVVFAKPIKSKDHDDDDAPDSLPAFPDTRGSIMKYIVEAFDKENEFLDFEIVLPDGCEAQLAAIMNWTSPQRGDEGYNVSDTQLLSIELLASKRFYDANHIFQLTCNVS